MPEKKLFVLDSYAMAFRMFYAFAKAPLVNSKGIDVSMVHGYWGALLRLLIKHKPTHIAIARDMNAPTFRHELYPDYKANRGPMPEEMALQMPLLKETLEASGIPLLGEVGFEADDIMASVAIAAERANFDKIFLVTKDKDMSQIVSDKIHLFHLEKGADGIDFGREQVIEKYGVPPEQIRDYLALMGDSSDNVPGVLHVGPKTAVELLKTFGNIDNIYENLESIKKKGLRDTLALHKENAFLSRELVTLQSSREFSKTLEELEFKGIASDRLFEIFKENELNALIRLLENVPSRAGFVPLEISEEHKEELPHYELIDTKDKFYAMCSLVDNATEITIDTKTDSLKPMECNVIGIAISVSEKNGYYVPLGHTDEMGTLHGNLDLEIFKEWFVLKFLNPHITWIFNDAKFNLHALCRAFSLNTVPKKIVDTLVLAWMLSPGAHNNSLSELVQRECNHLITPIEDIIGRGKTQIPLARVSTQTAFEYASECAVFILRLKNKIYPKICENGYEKFFNELEMPLLQVLLEMEKTGVSVDVSLLRALSHEMELKIMGLERDIYALSGGEFNISSPKQLAEVLFDKLLLPEIKKRSTDSSVLEELLSKTESPVVANVMEYREQKKLLSTYVNVLPTLINRETHRVHTTFLQWGTATGRLSSREPNLQNIPVRSESGKKIRASIVPGSKESVILAVDYSQIELRMLAHLSGDKNLIEDYSNGKDIHARTASAIYGVPLESVTSDMRRDAKVINFGVLYGMTAFRLSRDLKIERRRAQEFIDGYFELYSGVRHYIDEITEFVHKNGFVETLSGRRRYIPEIFSADKTECKMAERMAVNTPVQGSAAELIKIAMLRLYKRIKQDALPLHLMLQVHDELVFECPEQNAKELGQIVKYEMEHAMELRVPLVASVGFGKNWLEAH